MEIFKDEKIKKIIRKLKDAIKETHFENHVYIVGGAIRSSLLKQPIKDIDVVVSAENGGIMVANLLAFKERCYVKDSNPVVFEKYGTAKVNLTNDPDLKDIDIEFVQTRKEQYHEDSRNPSQTFGTIEEDAKRRDFTINSLYWNITTEKLHDYNCAIDDLTTCTIKTTSDPNIIFNQDPLRMLRCIRFSSQLGWGIEKNTWLGIIRNAARIDIVSQERITAEISKILVSPNASIGMRKLLYSGLLKRIMPDICELMTCYESRNPTVTTFDHTMKVLDAVQPILENRLAALFHDIGSVVSEGGINSMSRDDIFSSEVARGDLKEMKFPNAIVESVSNAIKYHRSFNRYSEDTLPPDRKIRKFVNSCGDNLAVTIDLMNANNLHCTFNKKKLQALDILLRIEELDDLEKSKNVVLPINGKEIIEELKLKKGGPIVGKILNSLKEAYFENPNITREECLERAKEEFKKLTV